MNTLILAGLLVATSVASDWQKFGQTPEYLIEVDINSVEPVKTFGNLEVRATIRRTLNVEIAVEGKTKKGSFYVDQTIANCTDDTLSVVSSALFSRDREVLGTGTALGTLQNPKQPGTFVTEFLRSICGAVTKNLRSGVTT